MGNLQYKKIRHDARGPQRAHASDAGADLVASAAPKLLDGVAVTVTSHSNVWSHTTVSPGCVLKFPLGISVEIPEGFEGTIRSRSGLGGNKGLCVRQGIGTIDSGYRGELQVVLVNNSNETLEVHNGDRIAQLVVSPINSDEWEETLLTTETERGTGGFGSSGQ